MNNTKQETRKRKWGTATLWIGLILLLCVGIYVFQTTFPTPLSPNQATIEAQTQAAGFLTVAFIETEKSIALTQGITLTVTPSATFTKTPLPPSPTPPITPIARINLFGAECRNGPMEKYKVALIMPATIEVMVMGKNSDGGEWLLVQNIFIGRCWIKANESSYEFDFNTLPSIPSAVTNVGSVCRTGPNTVYKEQTYIPEDWRIVIIGKNNSTADWLFVTPHDSTTPCWVRSTLFILIVAENLPYEEAPDPPTVVVLAPTGGSGGDGGGGGGGGTDPTPTQTPQPGKGTLQPTPTLCWPPGSCK